MVFKKVTNVEKAFVAIFIYMISKGDEEMFEPSKKMYMTRNISERLSGGHILFIVTYLHDNHATLSDYLQVFEFVIEESKQLLIQRQEEPKRESKFVVEIGGCNPINETVWAIDQGDEGVIILYPEDY